MIALFVAWDVDRWTDNGYNHVKMIARVLLSVLILTVAASARSEVLSVDITEWPSTGETKTPSGWTVNGIDLYKKDCTVTFDAVGDYAISPCYSGYVTQIVVSVYCTSNSYERNLKAIPERADASAATWTMARTEEQKYVDQSFAWPLTAKVRQFRLQIDGKKDGNWRVGALTVCLDRLDAPRNPHEVAVYSDALEVGWDPDSRSVSNEVMLAEVITVQPSFNLLREWSFSSLTNTSGNTTNFVTAANFPASLADVEGLELNLQGKAGGHLQIGKDNVAGEIRLPLPDGQQRQAVMTLFRHSADKADGTNTVSYVSGGATNSLVNPWLTVMPTVFIAALPDDAETLVIRSEKARRVRVEDVMIVTDYDPGSVTTNVMPSVRAMGNGVLLKGLSAGDFVWRVRSFDQEGFDSAWSPYRAVTIDAKHPPLNRPGLLVFIK